MSIVAAIVTGVALIVIANYLLGGWNSNLGIALNCIGIALSAGGVSTGLFLAAINCSKKGEAPAGAEVRRLSEAPAGAPAGAEVRRLPAAAPAGAEVRRLPAAAPAAPAPAAAAAAEEVEVIILEKTVLINEFEAALREFTTYDVRIATLRFLNLTPGEIAHGHEIARDRLARARVADDSGRVHAADALTMAREHLAVARAIAHSITDFEKNHSSRSDSFVSILTAVSLSHANPEAVPPSQDYSNFATAANHARSASRNAYACIASTREAANKARIAAQAAFPVESPAIQANARFAEEIARFAEKIARLSTQAADFAEIAEAFLVPSSFINSVHPIARAALAASAPAKSAAVVANRSADAIMPEVIARASLAASSAAKSAAD